MLEIEEVMSNRHQPAHIPRVQASLELLRAEPLGGITCSIVCWQTQNLTGWLGDEERPGCQQHHSLLFLRREYHHYANCLRGQKAFLDH